MTFKMLAAGKYQQQVHPDVVEGFCMIDCLIFKSDIVEVNVSIAPLLAVVFSGRSCSLSFAVVSCSGDGVNEAINDSEIHGRLAKWRDMQADERRIKAKFSQVQRKRVRSGDVPFG